MKRILLLILALFGVVALAGCGGSTVTRARLEHSMDQSFANRYVAQAHLLGHSGVSAASLQTRAFCDKGGPAVADHGPGSDWNCYLTWKDPNLALPDGTGKFEMNVHSNGCYTAGGPSRLTGLITITSTRGRTVDNPVFEWDGCFDTMGSTPSQPSGGPPATVSLPTGKIPIEEGQAGPELSCSAGARGGCIGTLTAKVGSRTIASTVYQLPPGGSNAFSFPVAGPDRKLGTKVTLSVAPFLGKVAKATSTVELGPPPPGG